MRVKLNVNGESHAIDVEPRVEDLLTAAGHLRRDRRLGRRHHFELSPEDPFVEAQRVGASTIEYEIGLDFDHDIGDRQAVPRPLPASRDGIRVLEKAKLTFDGNPEGFAVDTMRHRFYTNLEDKDLTLAIDLKSHKTVATWKPGCGEDGPQGSGWTRKRASSSSPAAPAPKCSTCTMGNPLHSRNRRRRG